MPSTSALADPERFVDFAADQPTLIVIDYAAEAPERVGQILHTLKDLAIIQALRAPLRVLLVERNAEHASWLARVSGAEEQKLAPFSARLGTDGDHLSLRALEDDLLWAIMLHIWAGRPLRKRNIALSKLHEIDPEGRPLFAQLVSDAVKHGADLGKLTKPGLLNDVILREKRRWRHLFVGNDAAMSKHENAVALATMLSGIDLSDALSGLDGDLFPFAGPEFRPDLVGAMLGVPPPHEVLPPWEPDLVGEWFVLGLLKKQNAFDDRPQQLMMSAEALSAADPVYAEQFGAFRIRALHDFVEDVPIALLFREPPVDAPPHAHAAWAASLADSAIPLLQHEGLIEQFLERLRELQARYLADSDVQVGICDAMQGISRAYMQVGAYHRALGLFSEVLEWTVAVDGLTSKAHSDMGWSVGRLGLAVGRTQIDRGRIVHATKTFEALRSMAHHLWKLGVDEKEEIANCAAELGLHIRRYFRSNGYADAAAAYDRALWGQPLSDTIDLAEASGEVLMHWSDEGTFGTRSEVYEELKRRSQRRPDAKAIAYWAASVGYAVARDAEETGDARNVLDAVVDLREWITTRADWPDMADIVWEAILHDWICENHSLGRVPLEAMLELWREAKTRDDESNEETALRMDLLYALKACGDKDTVVKIRASMSASF